jgi:hypothetical protein
MSGSISAKPAVGVPACDGQQCVGYLPLDQ